MGLPRCREVGFILRSYIIYFHGREVGFTRRIINIYYFHSREVGFTQRLYIISTVVRSGLPDGLLLFLLLPRYLSRLRVVRWGIPRFLMGI